MDRDERALSDIVAQILIAFLVVLVALFIVAAMTGVLTGFLQKTAFIAVTASPYETGAATDVISLYHKQGDIVSLNATSQSAGVSEIAIFLRGSTGGAQQVRNATPLHTAGWGPGQYLYIYPYAGGYGYSDLPPPAGTSLPGDDYTITIIDTRVKVLLHTLPVTIP
jgi:hypothetical protein